MSRSRAPALTAVALVTLALATLLYPGALLRGEAFFERDLHLDWYPRLAVLGRVLREGSLPLWAPGLGFGQPLAADPSLQVLYPTTWLALALPWGAAYTAFVLVHLVVAATGAARLALRLGAGAAGAWTAACLFVLSGPLQSAVNLWTHFAAAALMPWVLLAADTAVRRPGIRATLALAAAGGLQLVAGSPDVCAVTAALGLALVVARLLAARGAHWRRALGTLLAAVALAVALTCVVWWPAASVLARSPRHSLSEDVRVAWSVPPLGLARLVAPLDPARVPFEPGRWTRLYDGPAQPLLYSLYLGLPALGLAAASLIGRRSRTCALALLAAALLLTLFAMGPHAPLYRPLSAAVPLLQMLRFPSKALLALALVVSLLAGLGVRALRRAATPARLAVAALVLAASAASAIVSSRLAAPPGWSAWLGVSFALLVALRVTRARPQAGLASLALVGLAVADLLAAHRDLNATAPAAMLVERPRVADALQLTDGGRIHVFDYHTLPGSAERLLGRGDPYGAAAGPPGLDPRVLVLAVQRQLLVPLTAGFFGLDTSYDFDLRGLFPRDLNDLTFFLDYVHGTPVHTRLLQLGAVAKVVALHERGLHELRLEQVVPTLVGEPLRVFAVPDPRPRAWLVGRTRVVDKGAAFEALADPAFDPSVEALLAGGPALADPAPLEAALRWQERGADRQRLETTASRAAVLVLADAYDPGWRARVDGHEAELLRANVAFRAVAVPPGRHVVELVYRPRELVPACAVSLGALFASLTLVVAARRRGGRRPPH